jgi:hypothetical protein
MQINVENVFNNIFCVIIFKELQDVRVPLTSIIPFTRLFYGVIFHYTTNLGNMKNGSPLLNHLHA